MKKIQHIVFASALALALSATAFAGDIGVGKTGDIGVGKTGDVSVSKTGDIGLGLLSVIQTLVSIIP